MGRSSHVFWRRELRLENDAKRRRHDKLLETKHYLRNANALGWGVRSVAEYRGQWGAVLTFCSAAVQPVPGVVFAPGAGAPASDCAEQPFSSAARNGAGGRTWLRECSSWSVRGWRRTGRSSLGTRCFWSRRRGPPAFSRRRLSSGERAGLGADARF